MINFLTFYSDEIIKFKINRCITSQGEFYLRAVIKFNRCIDETKETNRQTNKNINIDPTCTF